MSIGIPAEVRLLDAVPGLRHTTAAKSSNYVRNTSPFTSINMRILVVLVTGLVVAMVSSPAFGERKVYLEAGFETGYVRASGGRLDAFWVMTMPDPQAPGDCKYFSPEGQGGFGPGSKTDFRVVQQEVWNGEVILPRSGSYFGRSVIHRDKCYPNSAVRSHLVFTTPGQEYVWDEEVWVGFSVYVPESWEHDNKYKRADQAHLSGMSVFASNASASSSHLALRIHPASDSDFNEWVLRLVPADPTSTTDKGNAYHTLGSISQDLGKWTDFVFRIRFNPFNKRTNPALEGIQGARDQWYEGNRGILQVWKSEGVTDSDGNRPMQLVFSRVDEPVGLVPRADRGLRLIFDTYKYSWQTFDTDPKGPIFLGYDEIRFGRAEIEGAGFADVAPSGVPVELIKPEVPGLIRVE